MHCRNRKCSFYRPDKLIIQLTLRLVSIASHVPADGLAAPPPVKRGDEIIELTEMTLLMTLTVQCQM